MGRYGFSIFGLIQFANLGNLSGSVGFILANCLYCSAEKFSTLGFGDLTRVGPIRLRAAAEALNGLLLIGRSASFAYMAMARFWTE